MKKEGERLPLFLQDSLFSSKLYGEIMSSLWSKGAKGKVMKSM